MKNQPKFERSPDQRSFRGVSLIELVIAISVLAITGTFSLVVVKFWKDQGIKSYNYGQVQSIKDALSIFLRTYGYLPDLSICQTSGGSADCNNFLAIYSYRSLEQPNNGSSYSVLPVGVTYTLVSDYVPKSFTSDEVPGTITLNGIGCDVYDKANLCSLRIVP
jgi:prepilin-type N-terminal cleavage/methylation domain-containing protein